VRIERSAVLLYRAPESRYQYIAAASSLDLAFRPTTG